MNNYNPEFDDIYLNEHADSRKGISVPVWAIVLVIVIIVGIFSFFLIVRPIIKNKEKANKVAEQIDAIKNAGIATGDEVLLGFYKQGDSDEETPIAWEVLQIEDARALLVSKYYIDCHAFHNKNENVTWADSKLRLWLNNDWTKSAFGESTPSFIEPTEHSTSGNDTYIVIDSEDTTDLVFIPDYAELLEYFDGVMISEPTEYVRAFLRNNDIGEDSQYCILRSMGYDNTRVLYSKLDGTVKKVGAPITAKGSLIRPMMWVDLLK